MKKDGNFNRYPKQFYVMGVRPIEDSDLVKQLDDSVRRQGYVPIQYGHQEWFQVTETVVGIAQRVVAKCTAVYLGKKQAKKITLVNLPEERYVIQF